MILKGSQRGGAKQLALHLLKTEENEHVEVHELRGFVADDLRGALHEAYAVSRGTRCRQFLFSLSLNPPETESVPVEVFEEAIEGAEAKLGLEGQPRAIVFHEKEGRRHAHCVWSRIDAQSMTARNLPHFKLKLRDVSRELFFEHGWKMPRGLMNSVDRDPANFSRAEWQQAGRAGHDPKALKEMFRECWAVSDSGKAFRQALAERGFHLARGDRRGHVAVDFRGEVYAISRWTDLRAKEVRAKLGQPDALPSVAEARAKIAERMTPAIENHIRLAEAAYRMRAASLSARKRAMTARHREDRKALEDAQESRRVSEARARSERLARGLRGLWDRLSGKYGRIRRQNAWEAWQGHVRDRDERDTLIVRQLDRRRDLQREILAVRAVHTKEVMLLHRDVAQYMEMAGRDPAQPPPVQGRGRTRGQSPAERGGPGLEL